MGERLDSGRRFRYLARRLRRVFLPWLAWFVLYCLIIATERAALGRPRLSLDDILRLNFTTAYWFIPNLVVALTVLILCSRCIRDWRWGSAFFIPAVFYAVNIYGQWLPVRHTSAFLGYVGYLWLGAWCSGNWPRVLNFIGSIPILGLAFATASAFVCATLEGYVLLRLHSSDPVNTLRFSNQLFSLCVILLFLKIRTITWPVFVNVREHTFGLYLAHTPVLGVFAFMLKRIPQVSAITVGWGGRFWVSVVLFFLTYSAALLITTALASSHWLKWSVGAR